MCQNQCKNAIPVVLNDHYLMLGQTLRGRYHITRQLGSGGFSTTFVAQDLDLPGQPLCVVKQLKSKGSEPSVLQTERRLFDTEAQVLYRLGKHNQIPQLYAHFEENQEFYLVQEYIQGDDFAKELASGNKINEAEAIAFLEDLLPILLFIHQQNVIHRDIKPSNLIRRQEDGKIVLIDFGAVKEIISLVLHSEELMTATVLIGSSGYMPTEQLRGKPRFNSDIYAVGITVIQALTGISPDNFVEDEETGEVIWREKVQVNNELAAIIDKMVRSHFKDRYQSVKEVIKDLEKLQNFTTYSTQILPGSKGKKAFRKPYLYLLLLIVFLATGLSLFIPIILNVNQSDNSIVTPKKTDVDSTFVSQQQEAVQLFNQGKTLIELQRYEEAIGILDKALQIDPKYPLAWVKRGYALSQLQKYEEALKSSEEALKIKSEYSQAWYQRALVLEKLNRDEEAKKSLNKAVEIQPNYAEAWQELGKIKEKLKDYEDAIISLDKATEINPDYGEAWYELGVVLNKLSRHKKASEALNKALTLEMHHVDAWIEHGWTLAKLNQAVEALISFDKALEIKPESASAWAGRGYVLGQLKRYDEAIASLDKAIQLKPDEAESWYQKGVILEKLNQDQEAIASLDKATQIKPDYTEAWYQRAMIFEKMKKYEESVAAYNKAIEIWPANQAAIKKRKQLLKKLGR